MSVTIHETRPCSPNYTKISPNFASQAPQGVRPSLWALHVMLFLPEDPPPNSPKHRLPRGSCRPHRAPASPPFPPQPHHSASRFLLRFCIATQGPELPAYYSSRICHRPRRGSLPFLGSLGGRCWARCLEAKKTPKAQVTSIGLS